MAETFLSPVIKKLLDLLINEAKSLKGVHKQANSLQKELEILEPLLCDAEAKSTKGELSDATNVWLRQLREEAERIEDVVDEYSYYAEQRRQSEVGFIGSIRKVGHGIKTLKTRHGLASEIRIIEESLQKIKDNGQKYGLRPFEQGSSSGGEGNSRVDPRLCSLFVEDNELVGIGSVSAELVTTLVEGSCERMVVSFVGEGGIGKTTLAKKVYKDVKEKGCFDVHVWVTVSQSYVIDNILKLLMAEICPSQGAFGVEQALTLLRSSLTEKRYVIVFDDVWQTDFWSVVQRAFPCNSNGSRVLVTTRNSEVVESFNLQSWEMDVTELKTWSTKHAWELFCRKAFPLSGCPPELENLSHKILTKCQGLPLAIVAVAGLLWKKKLCKLEWERVLDNLNCEFEERHELSTVSKVLSLSYHDLPYHLKLCFLYFGVFPEDSSVAEKRLWRIWIAEGFIELRKDKSLEQIAGDYMTELINRNLVSFELRYGSQRYCKVHDLIRDVIQKKASDLGFYQLFDQNKTSFEKKGRRLIIHNTTENCLESVCDMKIRSVVLVNTSNVSDSFVVGLFKKCKLLKVVDFQNSPVDNVSDIGYLLHLKNLNLRGSKVKTLPKSIGKLRNLQTLNVSQTLVRELPHEINKLHKLRHLFCGFLDSEIKSNAKSIIGVRMHERIGNLEELQSLNRVEAHSGFMKELQRLSKLKVVGISKVGAEMCKVLCESIDKMKDLEELFLISINNEEVLDLDCISSLPLRLRYLQLSCRLQLLPNWIFELQNLQGLVLHFSRLVDEPLKLLKGLPNLGYLDMNNTYNGEELQFEEGSFPKLKKLHLRCFKGLKVIKIEREALPLLDELNIGPSPLMMEIPGELRLLTKLKSLRVYDMPKEFVKTLQPDGGSEYFKIQHISSVTFWYYQGKGISYHTYKLGNTKLLQLLEEQH